MPVHMAIGYGAGDVEAMCPIGRIEKARDEALKAIAEAQRIHWVDAVSVKDYKVG